MAYICAWAVACFFYGYLNVCYCKHFRRVFECVLLYIYYIVFFLMILFFTSSCGRNFEDIDFWFFANCRKRMMFFFLYAICGHSLIIFSWNWKFEKGQILRKIHFSVNIDNVFFRQSVYNVLPFSIQMKIMICGILCW